MSGENKDVAEQLAMFEASVQWQWEQTVRLVKRVRTLARVGLSCEASLKRIEELHARSGQTLREYWQWIEDQGVKAEVDRILQGRKQTTKA